jgi:hypothetical protein
MLQHQRIFELTQLCVINKNRGGGSRDGENGVDADKTDGDDAIVDWAATEGSDAVVFVTQRSTDVCSIAITTPTGAEEDAGVGGEVGMSLKALKWFDNEDLRARAIAFSTEEDFVIVAAKKGDLIVVPAVILLPEGARKSKGARKMFKLQRTENKVHFLLFLGKDHNSRFWSSSTVTKVTTLSSSPQDEHPRQPPPHVPCSVLWWTTQDFRSLGLVGTKSGHLSCVDLVSGREVICVRVSSSASLVRLETITDNALDCTYLLLTADNRDQWRLLLEQRSTGYTWGVSIAARAPPSGVSSNAEGQSSTKVGSEEVQGLSRSRLSGLKQISVAGLANLRQRISDGKRLMLDGRKGGGGASSTCSNSSAASASNSIVELGEEALETSPSPFPAPDSLHPKMGDARVSVQRSSSDLQILAGVFHETAILTVHNCDLEVVPQSAFKLPLGVDKILILNRVMLVSSISGGRDGSKKTRTSCLHVVSSFHSELHLDGSNTKSDAVLQTFTFAPGEAVLAIVERKTSGVERKATGSGVEDGEQITRREENGVSTLTQQEKGSVTSQSNSLSSNDSSSTSSSSTPSPSSSSAAAFRTGADFCQKVNAKVASSRRRDFAIINQCVIVTTRAVYLVRVDQDPVTTFIELAVRGGSEVRRSEQLALAFGLDMKQLLELSGDIRLCDRDFTNAISLYRMSGCKHLKVVLKFAASGNVQELLSYLSVLFKTPNLEVTAADRVHLSNLALMAYFQQVLTKSTPTARSNFQQQIRLFLDHNNWFDDCLAVRMATETREWDLLGHVSRSRGLSHEMVDAIVNILTGGRNNAVEKEASMPSSSDVTRTLQEMSSAERNSLLACLLSPNNVEAMVASPKVLGRRLLGVLNSCLPLLEEQGLRSVLSQSSPEHPGLRPVFLSLLKNVRKESSEDGVCDFSVMILNLFIAASLMFLKKKRSGGSGSAASKSHSMPMRYLRVKERTTVAGNGVISKRRFVRRALAAGTAHVLLRRKKSVVTWGSSLQGVLGHGPTGARFSAPNVVNYFFSADIKVVSVACGKSHSLALTDNGLYAWGSSKHGQLGLGRQRLSEQRPVLVKALADTVIVSIAAGQYHSVALDDAGQVWTWGWGVHGQLGTRDIEDEYEPVRVFRSCCHTKSC